jgi:hypothetical protein
MSFNPSRKGGSSSLEKSLRESNSIFNPFFVPVVIRIFFISSRTPRTKCNSLRASAAHRKPSAPDDDGNDHSDGVEDELDDVCDDDDHDNVDETDEEDSADEDEEFKKRPRKARRAKNNKRRKK